MPLPKSSPNQSLLGAALLLRRATIREGKPFPLGATWDGLGVNFALFSAHATKVELCIFDVAGEENHAAQAELLREGFQLGGHLKAVEPRDEHLADLAPERAGRHDAILVWLGESVTWLSLSTRSSIGAAAPITLRLSL